MKKLHSILQTIDNSDLSKIKVKEGLMQRALYDSTISSSNYKLVLIILGYDAIK